MTRSTFLLIAAVVPGIFGLVMMLVPEKMLSNSITGEVHEATRAVTQWVGFSAFTVGVITFLSRNDAASKALKAVMTGNIIFHSLGLLFDIYDYSIGIMRLSGLVTGLVPHTLLIIGFAYYLMKLTKRESAP